jgi:hypothetical protein
MSYKYLLIILESLIILPQDNLTVLGLTKVSLDVKGVFFDLYDPNTALESPTFAQMSFLPATMTVTTVDPE